MKLFIPLLLLILLSGCATYSSTKFIRAESYETVIIDKTIIPSEVVITTVNYTSDNINKEYTIMGEIEVTVNKTTAFHPDPTKEIVDLALQEKAASIGADAVIEVVYYGPRISFASWGTMEAVGTAVKYMNVKVENIDEVSPNNNSEFFPFDAAVAQCKDLGLESGTEKFINCVKKLNGRD